MGRQEPRLDTISSIYINQSATTLKQLSGDVNSLDHLVTSQFSASKSCADQVHPFMVIVTLDGSGQPMRQCALQHQKTAQKWPEESDKALKASTWPPILPNDNPVKHLWHLPEQNNGLDLSLNLLMQGGRTSVSVL